MTSILYISPKIRRVVEIIYAFFFIYSRKKIEVPVLFFFKGFILNQIENFLLLFYRKFIEKI